MQSLCDDGLSGFVFGEVEVEAAGATFEAEFEVVDFNFIFAVVEGVVAEIGGDVVVGDRVGHLLVELLFLLEVGGVAATADEAAEVVETDHFESFCSFSALLIVDGEGADEFEAELLGDLFEEHAFVEVTQLRGGHDGSFVVAYHVDDGYFVAADFGFKLAAVVAEVAQ